MRRTIFVAGFALGLGVAAAIGFVRPDDKAKAPAGGAGKDALRQAAQEGTMPEMPPEMQKMMDAWMKWATPGAEHEMLAKNVGQWDLTVTHWMMPGMPPETSAATATCSMAMDGRYMVEKVRGEAMGQPFEGMAVVGYDNGLKKFVSIWIDNMGTGIMRSEGTMDGAGKVMESKMFGTDPMTGTTKQTRGRETWMDADTRKTEMWDVGPDGAEFKVMEIVYRRK